MTNKQLAMSAACAAGTFGAMQYAGYNGSEPAYLPGTGFSLNAEILKYVVTALAAFLPAVADKWLPGLGNIVAKILDVFRGLSTSGHTEAVVAPQPGVLQPPKPPCLCDDIDHLGEIAKRLDGPAQDRVVQTMQDLVVQSVKGKTDATKPA